MVLQVLPQFSSFISSPNSSTSLPWRRGKPERIRSNLIALMVSRDDRRMRRRARSILVMSTSNSAAYKMNLNEYMVTLEKPLGIRFALSLDGKIFVHSLRKGGNAERSKIIMVGDTLKRASDEPGGGFNDIKDLSDAEKMLEGIGVSQSLVLERPFSPYPVQQLYLNSDWHILFNRGKVPFASWNGTLLASNLQSSNRQSNLGFAIFSPKFLNRHGWLLWRSHDRNDGFDFKGTINTKEMGEIVGMCSEENNGNIEWGFGSFPLEEYMKALERSKGELYYNHSRGMQYTKITEQIYVGSCIQSESDVQKLSNMGITAVLSFQSESERANWGINSQAIYESCCSLNILMVNYPISGIEADIQSSRSMMHNHKASRIPSSWI